MTHRYSFNSRKTTKLLTLVGAIAIVTSGIIATEIQRSEAAYAAETQRLCSAAMEESSTGSDRAATALTEAESALEAVSSTELPGRADTMRPYGVPVRGDEATESTIGVVTARDGLRTGPDLIATVVNLREQLAATTTIAKCMQRDQASVLSASGRDRQEKAEELRQVVTAMLDDFAEFKESEIQRIAEEKNAVEEAAALETARLAEEHAAAAQAAWEQPQIEPFNPQEATHGHEAQLMSSSDWSSPPPADNENHEGGTQLAPPNAEVLGSCPTAMNCAL